MMRIGFIGAGRWATPYAEVAQSAGAEIAGVYAPDETATRLASRIQAQVFADARALAEASDLIVIGSPTDTHATYLALAAELGKSVFCASPIFPADKTDDVASPQGYASFPFRHKPEYVKLKESVESGALGDIGMIRIGLCAPKADGWRADAARSGGLLSELGVHGLDLLEWIGGRIERIYGLGNKVEGLEYQVLVARMASGSIAHLELSWAEAPGVSFDYYEVAGSKGLLDYDSRKEPELLVESRAEGITGSTNPVNNKLARLELQAVLSPGTQAATALVSLQDAAVQLGKLQKVIEGINGAEAIRM